VRFDILERLVVWESCDKRSTDANLVHVLF